MSKAAGIISMFAGFLFCVPAGSVAWKTLHYHQHDLGGVWLSALGLHLSFSGRQAWLFLAGCVFVGLALIVIGVFAMLSSSSSDSSA
jgi:hypothetical protein